jgi:hypothetical protein
MDKGIDLSEFRTPKKRRCLPITLAEKLTPEDREKFDAALEEKDITNRAIADWLKARTNGQLSEAVMRNHRSKSCGCYA